jgi:Matrixin
MIWFRFLPLIACVLLAACGGGSSPSAPSDVTSSSTYTLRGQTVSALDGRSIGRVNVKIGSQTATSDDSGSFELKNLPEGSGVLVVSGNAVVERQKTVVLPTAQLSREALIPTSFDLNAFDEMFRGTGRLQRWTSAPALVVLSKVMQFDKSSSDDHYHATSEQLTDGDVALMIEHLNEGLALLTGNTFTAFSSVEVENPPSGKRVNTLRPGAIVIGSYRGVQSLANTIGFGRWATNGTPEVVGGAIYLDRNYDRANESRRLLRIHELGHALGYLHVTVRSSIMNPAIGPEPSDFDRQGAAIAFQRMPGNQSPDNDVAEAPRGNTGGIFGSRSLARVVWAQPIICGH